MTNSEMIWMFLGIVIGFVCIVVAASGFRMGWRRRTWIGWLIAAFVFLTVIPVAQALTAGISPG